MRQVEHTVIACRRGNGTFDGILPGLSATPETVGLLRWARNTDRLHDFVPDYHRLQLERWLWDSRSRLVGRVMDIGVENPRQWVGVGYFTFGLQGCDVSGDLEALPFRDGELDAIICTEVLEHVANPFRAMSEMHRALKAGGLLLVTSPFLWPWHGTDNYKDYWRFTEEGWRLLLREFTSVDIRPCNWTREGAALLDIARRYEGWGLLDDIQATPAYLCTAVK